jgi:tRNA (guanine-N7-)-methyltransferase
MVKHMARKAKTPKFDYFNNAANCFGERQVHDAKWQDYLGNHEQKLTIEVGCARAELLLELARQNPDQNFLGVDRKSDRMWRPSKTAFEEKLSNIAFIQTDTRKLQEYIEPQTVDVIWVTFPDPYPRDRQLKHRLINKKFVAIYRDLLKPGGVVRFKTDDNDLYNFFIEEVVPAKDCRIRLISTSTDLHGSDLSEEYKIKTTYEQKWLAMGKNVSFAEFAFSQ